MNRERHRETERDRYEHRETKRDRDRRIVTRNKGTDENQKKCFDKDIFWLYKGVRGKIILKAENTSFQMIFEAKNLSLKMPKRKML